ncbi:MAG: hypothetical protein FJZ38_24625 [Candidatus Rokubacteria bacterium]|nr:hypothetical protein [Candidatus Rokubacteria bacterium]
MLHHLYGILERPPLASRVPDVGVDDRPVLVRRFGPFAVLSTLVERTPRATPCAIARHHDVLAAVAAPGPLFPLPYGVGVPLGALEAWLAGRAASLHAGLRLVRGCVEMHVSVLALHFGDGDPVRLCKIADRVAEATGVTSWRSRVSGRGGNAAITLAFLVPRTEVPGFLARIAPIASRAGDLAVVPSGPWPAFTFVPSLDGPAPAGAERAAVPVPFAV